MLNNPNNEKFICATEEYAITFFISIWLKAANDAYKNPIKAITTKTKIISYDIKVAVGNNNLNIANDPNFNKIPANITDPGVGASTCASGNQICKGTIGIFTAKPKKINTHISKCLLLK